MRVDLLNSSLWEDFNEALAEQARAEQGQAPDVQCRAYPDLAAGVTEIALGTSLFFSHKKTVAVIQGETWAFDSILPHLYKQGLQVAEVKAHQITDWTAWVDGLAKDTNFVLWSEDHPVTGEYNAREELDEALNARRIYSIRISHSAHRFKRAVIRPYTVRICSFLRDVVIAQCGTRFRTPPLFTHRSSWTAERLATFQAAVRKTTAEDEIGVKNFEDRLKESEAGFEIFPFPSAGSRLWDRSVIFNKGLNAEALLSELVSDGPLRPPGFEARAEAVNACRWTFLPELRNWWDPSPGELVLRGLLILSAETVVQPGFLEKLIEASKKARIE